MNETTTFERRQLIITFIDSHLPQDKGWTLQADLFVRYLARSGRGSEAVLLTAIASDLEEEEVVDSTQLARRDIVNISR